MKWFRLLVRFGLGVFIAIYTSGCVGHTGGPANSKLHANNPEILTGQTIAPAVDIPAIIVHIDPKTGKIIPAPSETLPVRGAQPQLQAPTKLPSELYETISPVPGGGVMIHLDERFMTPSTATIDADGKVRVEHQSSVSDSNEKK